MSKPLPPKDKQLTIKQLANLPEGTKVEYWYGSEYGICNPLKVQSNGYPTCIEGWCPHLIYAQGTKRVKRLKPLHVILSDADSYEVDCVVHYGRVTHAFDEKHYADKDNKWPESWYEEIDE